MEEPVPPPLVLCMESADGEEVTLSVEPGDNFSTFLEKAKSLLGYDVDINSITRNQDVNLNENIYQFLLNAEKDLPPDLASQNFEQILETNPNGTNDLVYILDDGTELRASQIQFDNEDPMLDLTAEKIPFVKYVDDYIEEEEEKVPAENIKKISIQASPVWTNKTSSPKRSFVNSLPFKLVCNNTTGFEAQFTKYLEVATNKTYTTLNTATTCNKSPRSLIKDNFKGYDSNKNADEYSTFTREDVLNMFKDSPVAALPYDSQSYTDKRRHARKSDPTRLVRKGWNSKPVSYVNVDGVLIAESESKNCFICGKFVNNTLQKLYLFDNEDQRLHRSSPQKKMSTQLKIICEQCLNEYFRPCRMKSPNQSLTTDEYLVIRNNQQYIFQKIRNFTSNHNNLGDAKAIIDKVESKIAKRDKGMSDFIKVEIGSDGEIITKPVDIESSNIDLKDAKGDCLSDVEIIENVNDIDDRIVDNLEEADEEVKEFLGKYQRETDIKDLKCRFCEESFEELTQVIDHCEIHKHDLEDGQVYPCPLCDYGYNTPKCLRGHLKVAHDKNIVDAKKATVENENEKEKPANESTNEITNTENDCTLIVKTEIKQETLDSSDDEIWIVQAAETEEKAADEPVKPVKKAREPNGGYKKMEKCVHCNQFYSANERMYHKCKRRTKRPSNSFDDDDQYLRITRPQKQMSDPVDTVVAKRTKKRSSEPTSNPQIVTCNDCNESFTSKVRLKFHMQFHSRRAGRPGYWCARCPDAHFPSEAALFDHVHFRHDKQRRWHCPVPTCGKTFYLRATLTKHSRTHTDTRRYVCVTCGKRFLDKQTLDEHGVTHLQIKPFQCHICMKQLTRRSRLRMHLRAHEEELTPALVLVCAVCGRGFASGDLAKEHGLNSTECLEAFSAALKQESEENCVFLSPTSGLVTRAVMVESPKIRKPIDRQVESPVAAPLLAQVSENARSIIRVVHIDKAFRCEYCEDVFYTEETLNNHRVIHKNVKNPFTCHICKVSFATYSRCTTHKTTHGFYKRSLADAKKHGDSEKPEAGPSSTGILGYGGFPVVKHFLCEDCGRSYLHWTYLQVHRRMKHANENFLFKCNLCGLTFANSWSVAYHRKKIHGAKTGQDDTTKIARDVFRIPCRDCDEILPNKNALYKHRQKEHSAPNLSDEKEEDLWCESCNSQCNANGHTSQNKTVSDNGESQSSIRDTSASPRTFRSASVLGEHSRSETTYSNDLGYRRCVRARAWACGRCPRRYRARAQLRTHLRTEHPECTAVLEMQGLNPSDQQIMDALKKHNISYDKVIEIVKMCFTKGTTSIIPHSARTLSSLLATVPTQVVCIKPNDYNEEKIQVSGDQQLPASRDATKCIRKPIILQHSNDETQQNNNQDLRELNPLNIRTILQDGVIVSANQMMLQMQLDDPNVLDN